MAIKLHDSFAVHPGKWLSAEIVESAGVSVTALAERLHVTRQVATGPFLSGLRRKHFPRLGEAADIR